MKKIKKMFNNMFLFLKSNRKTTWTVITNIIIAICIFSAFTMCFNVDTQIASSNGYSAIYRGNINEKKASLMINVYWGTEFVEPMLEVLKQYDVKTTFFVGGYWASKNDELLNRIVNDGHELANHGYYHKDQSKLSLESNLEEISINHQLVKSITGVDMTLFAPPSGSFNNNVLTAAENLGYKTIMWSKDTIDWRDKNESLIIQRATKNMQNGDLILMHPTQCTYQALESIIKTYQNAAFKLTTVSDCIS